MTDESPENVLLRYVREELSTLRATMHDELAALRKDIMTLSLELQKQSQDEQPRLAKLETRTDRCEADIEEIKTAKGDDRASKVRMWSTLGAAALGVVGSWAFSLFGG